MGAKRPPLWRRAARSIWRLIVGLSVVAGIIAVFVSKDFRHAVRDAAQWLYPDGVVAVLGAFSVALAMIALLLRKRSARAEQSAANLQATLSLTSAENEALNRRIAELEAAGLDARHLKDAATFLAITNVLTRNDIKLLGRPRFRRPVGCKAHPPADDAARRTQVSRGSVS
jgi:hypothetical protein